MTKKSMLSVSRFFTFLLFVLSAFITWTIQIRLEYVSDIVLNSTTFTINEAFYMFGGAVGFLIVMLLLKLLAKKVERNLLTFFVMILDLAVFVFFAYIFENSIRAAMNGQILDNIFTLSLIALSALAAVADLFSFPLRTWRF